MKLDTTKFPIQTMNISPMEEISAVTFPFEKNFQTFN